MGDVIHGKFITRLDIPPDRILEAAAGCEYGLKEVIIIGIDRQGEFYLASSSGEAEKVLWMIERAKHNLVVFHRGNLERPDFSDKKE